MLDKPKKTQQLIAALKAALPFEVDLTPPAIALLARQQDPIIVKPPQIVLDIIYTGDEGGITCHIHPTESRDAIFISLTHVRVHRSLPYAPAVIDYQKHRIKIMKKQRG